MSLLSFILIWNNEKKVLRISSIIKQIQTECHEVKNINKPSHKQDFKLVYVSGTTKNNLEIEDYDFCVSVPDAVALHRHVEMF